MKMEPTVSSETSAIRTQTPGNYPKRKKLHLEHGESSKTRRIKLVCGCFLLIVFTGHIPAASIIQNFTGLDEMNKPVSGLPCNWTTCTPECCTS